MTLTSADIVALTGAGLALVTGVGSIMVAVKARREAAESAKEAARLQALDWATQYFEGVRDWSEEVVDSISTLIHLHQIADDSVRATAWVSARSALSALCDRGRWFFPNKFEKEYGPHKPQAYRGIRRRILDFIVAAYDAVPTCPAHDDRSGHDPLVAAQRGFVSEVQEVLNPRHREEQLRAISHRFGIVDQMRKPNETQE